MKVKGTSTEAQQDTVKISRQAELLKEKASKAVSSKSEQASANDSVNISLAKFISDQLDPTKMADERRQKIENLKKLIASGEYKPSSQVIAQSMEEELGFEIMTSDEVKSA
ncbi:MAG: flagellar biosynthesis anti-sigma factor FlgM [Deltaproteobacteria bacterium]|nr:flagellar biosynthesis anti-sigma factor FlgM [Deltaproteobacteria bacterium]